ncbi:MAG: hypothetical protein JSS49_10450 [Planctomycetes bacterium]|nr:hypothetical protein [Planctomycetota bacterium]
MAVPIEHSHGLPEDGKTVAPQLEKGDGLGCPFAVRSIQLEWQLLTG